MSRRPGEGKGASLSIDDGLESSKRSLRAPVAGIPGPGTDWSRCVEAMLPKPRIDSSEGKRAAANDREGVGESIALAAGSKPFPMSIAKQVEIIRGVHPEDRLQARIDRRMCRSDRGENGIDSALVFGRRMQLAVEKFGSRGVSPLPF